MSETRKDPAPERDPGDDSKDWIVGKLLLVSSLTGVILAIIGAAIAVARGEKLAVVSGRPLEVFSGAARLDGNAIAELGLLVLMITPVLRIAVLTIFFALEPRDRRYALASFFVLVLLGIGIALGHAG